MRIMTTSLCEFWWGLLGEYVCLPRMDAQDMGAQDMGAQDTYVVRNR